MTERQILKLLEDVRRGKLTPLRAAAKLKHLPFEDLDFAKIDHHRMLRQGMTETVYGAGKTPEQIERIVRQMMKRSPNVLVTRASAAAAARLKRLTKHAVFHALSGCIAIHRDHEVHGKGKILVASAGSSDIPVAEEAIITAELLGNEVAHIYDVGVAGIHRLLHHHAQLVEARVIICAAGMEGALPSVVGGLTGVPLVAVPTSTGYGTGAGGLAALLAMLNSCAPGVVVVNVDNGYGAGVHAARVARRSRPRAVEDQR